MSTESGYLHTSHVPLNLTGPNISAAEPARLDADVYVAPPVRWAFYLFMATIPFETLNLGIGIELTVLSLGLLFLSLIFHPPLVFNRPPLAYVLFGVYLIVFAIPFLMRETDFGSLSSWSLIVLFQLLAMSWVAYNLMLSDRIARGALLALAASCLFLAVLQWAGISAVEGDSRSERITALGFHPNNIARILSVGLLALLGITYGQRKSFLRPRYLVWIGVALLAATVIKTGSRGGLLALGAGVVIFALRSGSVGQKVRNAAIVVIAIGFFAFASLQSESTASRFEDAFQEGDLARREQIYPTAWQMFKERPLFGWGPVAAEYELGSRLAHVEEYRKNAHNMILNVLMSSGIVGAVPLFGGTLLALWAAWTARRSNRGIVPLSLITMVLVANMSGIWTGNKLHWLVMAYALSSATAAAVVRARQGLSVRNLRGESV